MSRLSCPPHTDVRVFGREASALVRSVRAESRGGLLLVLRELGRLLRLRLSVHHRRHRFLQGRSLSKDHLLKLFIPRRPSRLDWLVYISVGGLGLAAVYGYRRKMEAG